MNKYSQAILTAGSVGDKMIAMDSARLQNFDFKLVGGGNLSQGPSSSTGLFSFGGF